MTRRSFNSLPAGLALSSVFAREASSSAPSAAPRFPFGTHVYREPSLPLEQLRSDFPILKKLGFNMVKIQESWSTDERNQGQVDLTRVCQVVSDARQQGLSVYFGVTMEQAPAWLWQKFPDAAMRYEDNRPVIDPTQYLLPNDGKPGPCWNHPAARAAAIRFIEAVGKQVGQYDNVLVWNVWQEIGFGSDTNFTRFCFCPNTLSAFREWLKNKFASLTELNTSWRTAYAEWGEIDPPRVFHKVPSYIDWRYFMENVYLADAVRWKSEAFRRSDPHRRKILAHAPSPRYGGSEDWRMASAGLDIYGSSCYPGWGEYEDPGVSSEQRLEQSPAPYMQVVDNAIKWDYIRSASVNGEFWTAELQGGRASGGVTPGRVPDAGDIRRWVLGALAGGARGICFWNHRSEMFWDEAYGFGLLELTGASTARAAEAGRIGAAIDAKAPDLFAHGSCPIAQTAILLDESLWNFTVGSGDPLRSAFVANLRGVHRALWQEGIPVDFMDSRDLATAGHQYKALILPLPLSMSEDLLHSVSDYVAGGGTVISGPFPGRFSHYGFATPGGMPSEMVRIFGVRHKEILTLTERVPQPSQSSFRSQDSKPIQLSGSNQYSGRSITSSFYLQYLILAGATDILRFQDEVVGSEHQFGNGKAILLGTLFGSPVQDGETANQVFLAAALKDAGVLPDRVGKLPRRQRQMNGKAAWFLFNPTRALVEESVALGTFAKAEDLLGAPYSVADRSIRVRVAPLDICCLLLS